MRNASLVAEISLQGEKYLDKQIENAVNGVKEMKSVMQKSSEDHKRFLDALEKTKEQKEVPDDTARIRQRFFILQNDWLTIPFSYM